MISVDLFHAQVSDFVEHLLQGAITLALTDATKAISSSEDLLDMPSYNCEHLLQRQSSMDHLEVNFRDWYSNYRRRSSNLSDLSSRRSSYDLASRRSSACSARGYSSEYSSEFEEYYDNFQQEQRYKYHTIKEEVGSTPVHEFASFLAARLLQEGTREASCNVLSEFNGELPNYDIQRPLPIRISTTSLSTVESVENEEAIVHEDCVRQYVDELFDNIWPFTGKSDDNKRDEDVQKSFLQDLFESSAISEKKSNESTGSIPLEDYVGEPYIVDEMVLTAVADHLVGVAFQEALLEYRYLMNETGKAKVNSFSSVSESGQSDHSMEIKDQSEIKPSLDQAVKVAEKVMTSLFSGTDFGVGPISSSPPPDSHNDSNIPIVDICDSNLLVVDNTCHKSHSKYSASSEENESCVSGREVQISIDVRVVDGSVTTKSDSDDNHSCNLNNSYQSSHSDSTCNSDDMCTQNLSSSDKYSLKMSGMLPKIDVDDMYARNTLNEVTPKKLGNTNVTERQWTSSLLSQKSSDSGDNIRHGMVQSSLQNFDSNCQDGLQVSNNVRPFSGSKSNKLKPPSQGRLKHVYVSGNRKNYDQFANSLSRDLLTNAFLQVQEHSEPVTYPRRSSEPMQISNGAALQRFEHTVNSVNGRHGMKSKTDEDISQFDDEWLQPFKGKSSCGFRDPVLSR